MAVATVGALPFIFSVEAVASCTGRASQPGGRIVTNVRFIGRPAALSLRRKEGREGRLVICRAEGGEGKSCCGGGGSEGGSSGGKCSSHGGGISSSSGSAGIDADVSGIGKEFEALVATKTMQEFESQYDSGEMVGNISRDVIADVVNIYPDAASKKSEEKFLDIDELLAEARALSTSDEDFIFDSDFEEMLV